jgi:putative spermidine/putrescine transport system ATP-binding protein
MPLPETFSSQSAAAGAASIVRFGGVSKNYGVYQAIDNIDLNIERGEFITFLGPSGSGKTTTLMMLAGFEKPSKGAIEMEGRRIERLPAHKRDIGVVFQNYALFPHMSIAENLAFPLSVRGVAKAEISDRVNAALAMVHLEGLSHRKPAQLSGGQQQRVALARAIIFRPRLIVLDEPLGALDKNLREHLQVELKILHRELGTTMVFVTHDQSEALALSDRVAVFNKGRIEQIDTPERLYERPATPFVASFIGENNMLDGKTGPVSDGIAHVTFPEGGTLFATAPEWCGPQQRITFSIRPENIRIASGTATPGCQRIEAPVADLIYLGDQKRVLVDAPGIGRLAVKAQSAEASGLERGARITLELPQAACQLLPAQQQ